jgi:hypothetical protein
LFFKLSAQLDDFFSLVLIRHVPMTCRCKLFTYS